MKKYIKKIYEIVDYYRTDGNPGIYKKTDLYELIDFYENFILRYHTYVYDVINQEIVVDLIKSNEINGLDIILEEKLNEIINKTKNKEVIRLVNQIKDNSFKINSMTNLIDLLKNFDLDITELEKLYFLINKLNLIKNNRYTENDLLDIKLKFKLKKKSEELLNELINDKKIIDDIHNKYKYDICNIKQEKIIDKIIEYLDKKLI